MTIRAVILSILAMGLCGCADPMAQLDRLSETDGTGGAGIGFIGSGNAPAKPDVTAAETMAFGEIGRNCTVSARDMGKELETASGYRVYDTAPGTKAPRTLYITGFDDDCARQVTGVLTLFGDVGTHEFTRYTETGLDLPYTLTDEAYEVIKGAFCRVGRTEPCGKRLDRLARNTSFVTVYEDFTSRSRWLDILLHRGEVVASDIGN